MAMASAIFSLLFLSLSLYSLGYVYRSRCIPKVHRLSRLSALDKEIAKGQEYLDKIARKKELKRKIMTFKNKK
jgi:hypothetical protein